MIIRALLRAQECIERRVRNNTLPKRKSNNKDNLNKQLNSESCGGHMDIIKKQVQYAKVADTSGDGRLLFIEIAFQQCDITVEAGSKVAGKRKL